MKDERLPVSETWSSNDASSNTENIRELSILGNTYENFLQPL